VKAVLAVLSAARPLGSVEGFGLAPCRYHFVLPHEVVDRRTSKKLRETDREKQNTMIRVRTSKPVPAPPFDEPK
jgi:hypothetical protein